jgi:hypothetical protein
MKWNGNFKGVENATADDIGGDQLEPIMNYLCNNHLPIFSFF